MAELPELAAIYLPSEDDYGLAIKHPDTGQWLLLEASARPGALAAERVGELVHAVWSDRTARERDRDAVHRAHDRRLEDQ